MNTANPFQIATPCKTKHFDVGESPRTVEVTRPDSLHWLVTLNKRPIGEPTTREGALNLARTLDPGFEFPPRDTMEIEVGQFAFGAANQRVRPYTRHDASGRAVQVGGYDRNRLEKLMREHDTARFRAKSPDQFRAHSLSLDAFSASDKAESNDEFHDLAAKLHGEAAEAHDIIGGTEATRRHKGAADFHASKARSAGNAVMNVANEILAVGPSVRF